MLTLNRVGGSKEEGLLMFRAVFVATGMVIGFNDVSRTVARH
jgi:hypothetical protein